MSNLRWCIHRRAAILLMEELGISDITVAEASMMLMPENEKMRRLKEAAAAEGEPAYFD